MTDDVHICERCGVTFPRYRRKGDGRLSQRRFCDSCNHRDRMSRLDIGNGKGITYDPRTVDSRPCSKCGTPHSNRHKKINATVGEPLFRSHCTPCRRGVVRAAYQRAKDQRKRAMAEVAEAKRAAELRVLAGSQVLIAQRRECLLLLARADELLSRLAPDNDTALTIRKFLRTIDNPR